MTKKLWDPEIGGLRRREEVRAPFGDWDIYPWIGCTLWLADAFIELGEIQKAEECISWVKDSQIAGILPENLHYDGPHRFPMFSYSSAGYVRTLLHLNKIQFYIGMNYVL